MVQIHSPRPGDMGLFTVRRHPLQNVPKTSFTLLDQKGCLRFPAIPLDTMQPKITGQFDCGYGEDELIFGL